MRERWLSEVTALGTLAVKKALDGIMYNKEGKAKPAQDEHNNVVFLSILTISTWVSYQYHTSINTVSCKY